MIENAKTAPIKEEDLIPSELQDLLKENDLVVFCWTCGQLLYATESVNQITERVATNAAGDHYDAFTVEDHGVEIWRKRGHQNILVN